MARIRELLAYAFLSMPLWSRSIGAYGQDNTKCASAQLDWYTNVVGETPCVTYQRLRQICNSDYEVGKFRSNTPGDNCNDQVSECCCNSISWALSMLCMNCQYATAPGDTGIDAGDGAFDLYLNNCNRRAADKTLPNDIQTAVCNKKIKIDDNLYSLFWDSGAWYYVFTKETMEKSFSVHNNNTFTHCASTTINDTDTTSSSSIGSSPTGSAPLNSVTSDPSPSSSKTSVAPIVGGIVGGVLGGLAIAMVAFFLWRRRRSNRGPAPLDLSNEYTDGRRYSDDGLPGMSTVTPFSVTSPSAVTSPRYGDAYSMNPTSPETETLLPSSPTGPGSSNGGPASSSGATSTYDHGYSNSSTGLSKHNLAWSNPTLLSGEDVDRHEDGGPVPFLQRSASGRLPPAYRESWDARDGPSPPPLSPPPQLSVSVGGIGSDVAEGSSSAPPVLHPQYRGDVKHPNGPSS